jgi:hypothetical protein
MSTKSQKTEDMLDQTFANFDTEVTGAETQQASSGKSNSNEAGKKTNMMLFIGAGVAAVLSIGYLFVIKPMLEPAPMHSVKSNAVKPMAAAPEVTPTPTPAVDPLAQPSQAQATDPLAQPNQAQATDPLAQPNQATDPLGQPNQVQAQVTDPLAQPNQAAVNPATPTVEPMAQANQVHANANANPVAPTPTPVAATTKPVTQPVAVKAEAPVASANVQSVAVVDELKSMFDKQSNEFKTVLTDIDTRVGGLESAINEQKNVNSGFDQRITALEGKKPVVNQPRKASVAKSTVVRAKKKASVAKPVKNDAAVLLDNSADKPKAEKVEKVEKSSLANVAVHSIYSGRLWVKNNDGSLSTYSAGEKLPTGEVIKSIDDENFSVTTDKRVIKN